MVYRFLVGGERKEWLFKEEFFVIMKDMFFGYFFLFRLENFKNVIFGIMERVLDYFKSRLIGVYIEWWIFFVVKEIEKREIWENMTEEEYLEVGEFFDISVLFFKFSFLD